MPAVFGFTIMIIIAVTDLKSIINNDINDYGTAKSSLFVLSSLVFQSFEILKYWPVGLSFCRQYIYITFKYLQELPVAVRTKLNEDAEFLRNVVTYHVSPAIKECRHLHDNQQIPTLNGINIRINSYSQVWFCSTLNAPMIMFRRSAISLPRRY